MRRATRFSAVGAACLLLLTACGSDSKSSGDSGGSAAEKPYVAALEKSMTSSDGSGLTLSSKQASCMAPKWIHTIGVDRLTAKGVTPEDVGSDDTDTDFTTLGLSEAEGGTLYDTFGTCDVDVKSLFISGLDDEMSDADTACVEKNFSDALLKKVLVTELIKGDEALQADPELTSEIQTALGNCPGALGS